MLGFVRKKKIRKKMKEIKDEYRKEKLYAKYPADSPDQERLNIYSQGFEDGIDNFYNGLKHIVEK